MEKWDVLVQGVVTTDVIFSEIPKMPEPGEEVYCGEFEFTGGAAYITAVALSRLGLKVAILSPIGTDVLSQFIVHSLESEGVSTKLMKRLDQPLRTLSVAINYGGDRSFLSYQDEAKGFDLESYTLEILDQAETNFLHMSVRPNSLPVIQKAKEKDIQVALDVGWDEEWLKNADIYPIIKLGDYFTPNLREALYMTEQTTAAKALNTFRVQCPYTKVIIKLGPEGALSNVDGNEVVIPGFKRNAIDTTGAGDVFAAGLIAGVIKGHDLKHAIRLGNFCGACSVEGLGGATASPYWEQVEKEFLPIK